MVVVVRVLIAVLVVLGGVVVGVVVVSIALFCSSGYSSFRCGVCVSVFLSTVHVVPMFVVAVTVVAVAA